MSYRLLWDYENQSLPSGTSDASVALLLREIAAKNILVKDVLVFTKAGNISDKAHASLAMLDAIVVLVREGKEQADSCIKVHMTKCIQDKSGIILLTRDTGYMSQVLACLKSCPVEVWQFGDMYSVYSTVCSVSYIKLTEPKQADTISTTSSDEGSGMPSGIMRVRPSIPWDDSMALTVPSCKAVVPVDKSTRRITSGIVIQNVQTRPKGFLDKFTVLDPYDMCGWFNMWVPTWVVRDVLFPDRTFYEGDGPMGDEYGEGTIYDYMLSQKSYVRCLIYRYNPKAEFCQIAMQNKERKFAELVASALHQAALVVHRTRPDPSRMAHSDMPVRREAARYSDMPVRREEFKAAVSGDVLPDELVPILRDIESVLEISEVGILSSHLPGFFRDVKKYPLVLAVASGQIWQLSRLIKFSNKIVADLYKGHPRYWHIDRARDAGMTLSEQ